MSLETFEASRCEAAERMGMPRSDLRRIQEATEPRAVLLGIIEHKGDEIPAITSESGNFDPVHPHLYRGGNRMDDSAKTIKEGIALTQELSVEMRGKQDGEEGGRKGLLIANGRKYSLADRKIIVAKYADLMIDHGFAGPYGHIISADMNTAKTSDAYAQRYRERTNNPLWRASAAGKLVENGGLKDRPEATGLGVIKSLKEIMRARGEDTAYLTFMGFGQVAAWAALNAGREREVKMYVKGISELGGVLTTDDPRGMPITEKMIREVGDNPDFSGDKIQVLQEMIAKEGVSTAFDPNNEKIAYVPTDYFIPAAGPDVITLERAKELGARRGVIEGGNGVTKPDAHRFLVEHGILVDPDFLANGSGVDCSSIEWAINVGLIDPKDLDVRQLVIEHAETKTRNALAACKELKTPDLRVGAAAVNLAHLARYATVTV